MPTKSSKSPWISPIATTGADDWARARWGEYTTVPASARHKIAHASPTRSGAPVRWIVAYSRGRLDSPPGAGATLAADLGSVGFAPPGDHNILWIANLRLTD